MARTALAPLLASIPAADGLVLRAELRYPAGLGAKFPLAVLAHQYPATRHSYEPLCIDLLAAGVAALTFDLRGHGDSIWSPSGVRVAQTPAEPTMEAFGAGFMGSAGAIGFAHLPDDVVRIAGWGLFQNYIDPARLLLVGSSVGGSAVLLAASRLQASLKGVLTFGAAGPGAISSTAMQEVRRNCETVRVPMLLTTSEGDPFDGANNAREWGRGLAHVTTRIVPGADHAMAIYHDVRRDVVAFVRSALGMRTAKTKAAAGARRRR